jgi:hypothetical protein
MKLKALGLWGRALRCRALWVGMAALASYVVLGAVLPTQPFLEFVRIVMATAAVITAVAYGAEAWESATTERSDQTDSIVIGIFLQHFTLAFTGVWLLLYRLAGRPEWMLNTLVFGFVSGWLSALASSLHVWAPGVLRRTPETGEVPSVRLRAVGIAAALGVFATLVVLATQPNAIWLVESMRPWVW